MMESIMKPNAQIAPGFESVLLKLKGNVTVGGILKKETDNEIVLADPNEGEQEIDKADIISRSKGLSPMPEGMDKMLTKRELRDLVEFLASLKEGMKVEPASGHGG
jgi:quinoprotein glucose dehydrogenase